MGLVPVVGLEPTRGISPADFESATSTNSITPAKLDFIFISISLQKSFVKYSLPQPFLKYMLLEYSSGNFRKTD